MKETTPARAALTASRSKVDKLFALKEITLTDIADLTRLELEMFSEKLNQILDDTKGTERDSFIAKIGPVLQEDSKNDIWRHNHMRIHCAISNLILQCGVMPSQIAIAEESGLSRQTVSKHFKEYKTHPEYINEADQFKFMSHKVLTDVLKSSGNGDMRAARLYFEIVGAINKPQPNTVINEQNNYIQINNTILRQENLNQLSAAQLQLIENIVMNRGIDGAADRI